MKFGIALATLSLGLVSAPVLADDLGDLNSGVPFALSGGVFTKALPTTTTFTFSLSADSTVTGGFNNIVLPLFGNMTALDATSISYTFKGATTSLASPTDTFSLGDLKAGNYSFDVTGTGTGVAGGAFVLALSATPTAPVPGPAGALVAAGGLAALAYGRRRAKLAAA